MYHIRRVDNHDERSIHMENELGLKMAMSEAVLRTHHTGALHEIVDDNGERAFIVDAALLADVREKFEANKVQQQLPKPIPTHVFLLAALLAAMVLHIFFVR